MEEQIIRSIKRYIPDLVDMTLAERPDADRGSVEVTAAVMMLEVTIYILNTASSTPQIHALIDALVDRLPRNLEDRKVNLADAIPDPQILERASEIILGAYHTNLLGAFKAIYNARVAEDLGRMGSMTEGPLGDLGGVCIVTSEALIGTGKTPNFRLLTSVYSKHISNILEAIKGQKVNAAGSKACFVATACYGSPYQETVVTLRHFREDVLKKYPIGRAFVKYYYRIGPRLASKIRYNDLIRYPLAITLTYVAIFLRYIFNIKL